MGLSLMQKIALLDDEERAEALKDVDPEALLWDWSAWARPEQRVPDTNDWAVFLYLAGRGAGKALALDTPIPTPSGWSTMGDLKAGDFVFDETGKPVQVVFATGIQHGRTCYEVVFDDGSSIVADAEHLWVTWDKRARKAAGRAVDPQSQPEIRDTSEILASLRLGSRQETNHSIPVAGSLELPTASLAVSPYTLGVWLGDGSSACADVTICDRDSELLDLLAADGTKTREQPSSRLHDKTPRYTMGSEIPARDPVTGRMVNNGSLHTNLRSLGLLRNKHIPTEYLRASSDQRLELLKGLMDTDGCVSPRSGRVEFTTVKECLATGVLDLVRSLGFKPTLGVGRATLYGRDCGPKYRVCWSPRTPVFKLSRKVAVQTAHQGKAQVGRSSHRFIVDVREVESAPVKCIEVASVSHLYLAGGAMVPTHNTRAGCEWAREKAKAEPGSRGGLVARTAADVRDVLISGESGILNVCPPSERPEWEPSKRKLTWPNGTSAICFSAEEPSQLRGPQFDWALADELAAWKALPDDSGLNAWDNLTFATRLGSNPQRFVMTTPKRTPMLRELLKKAEDDTRIVVRRGSTKDNAANLAASYLEDLYGQYAGTRQAAQELDGLMLDDVEGALWTLDMLENARLFAAPAAPLTLVVGVDPSVSERSRDECGIVVFGATREQRLHERHGYVLEDSTIQGTPDEWAQRVVSTAKRWNAPVVVEINQGGGLVRSAIATIDPTVRVYDVHSRQNKQLRAEPVVMAYEQMRVHHIGYFPELESQMTSWMPEDKNSPDRVDALVHAATALMVRAPKGFYVGGLRSHSVAGRRLPPSRTAASMMNPRGRAGGVAGRR